jgi:GNAT superfamily N-acetyltransferase
MTHRHRAFNGESDDFNKMMRFIIEHNRIRQNQFTWSIGRLVDWKYGLWSPIKYFPTFFSQNAELWFDYLGDLIGFAISEGGDGSFTLFTEERHSYLYSEMLEWVIHNWADREGTLTTEVNENQFIEQHTLEAHQFVSQGICEVTRAFDCENVRTMSSDLPAGFTFSTMQANYRPLEQLELKLNAFRKRGDITELDIMTHEYVRTSPLYNPAFDFYVMDALGKHVAGCEAFIDVANGSAEIERVCTHSDFRKRGLAKAVLLKCMQALADHGIHRAYITGMEEMTIRLYGTLGHLEETKRCHYTWTRD